MSGVRELLAVVLGIALGVMLVATPRTAIRLSVVLGSQRHRHGEYGSDNDIPVMWAWVVRVLGLACVAVAGFIASQAFV